MSSNKKKIGILTYFYSDNPGTFFQAYAVSGLLREHFPEATVEIINYRLYQLFWRPNLKFVGPKQWVLDYKRHAKYKKSRANYLNISKPGLVTKARDTATEFIAKQGFDMIVVGSDTILELNHYNGGVGAFYLDERIAAKKIMISASCRAESFERLSESQREIIGRSLAGFDLMGVRDAATKRLIESFSGTAARVHPLPDPTVCCEIDYRFSDTYTREKKLPVSGKIVALHLPKNILWARELAGLFRAEGYTVVSLGPSNYADYVLNDTSPLEWAGLFKKFDLVITSRFHDSMFCIKNKVPFITVIPGAEYISNDGTSKYHHLLSEFKMPNNLIPECSAVTAADVLSLSKKVLSIFPGNKIDEILEKQRSVMTTFVKKARKTFEEA